MAEIAMEKARAKSSRTSSLRTASPSAASVASAAKSNSAKRTSSLRSPRKNPSPPSNQPDFGQQQRSSSKVLVAIQNTKVEKVTQSSPKASASVSPPPRKPLTAMEKAMAKAAAARAKREAKEIVQVGEVSVAPLRVSQLFCSLC
jgi:hypothetical protein